MSNLQHKQVSDMNRLKNDVMASSYPEQVTSQGVDNEDSGSETSSIVHNGSVISTVPDRHGFLGGTQYSTDPKQQTVPAIVVLRREQKWLRMLAHWDRVMNANYKKVRERCRKGIPPSVRPRAWLFLCGGKLLLEQSKTLYKELILQEGDARWVDDIRKDLHRQFPFHEMFVDQAGHGQRDLFQVLKAYSILNESVGYCQAQAPVAAFLLMHMPAEEAFWCLVSICDKYLTGYYSQGMFWNITRDGLAPPPPSRRSSSGGIGNYPAPLRQTAAREQGGAGRGSHVTATYSPPLSNEKREGVY
uniref:Rab-GAP TBC domain-containing protein n=1 Tax=Timema poppense TaxID=170557 RepID=A0A7R9H7E3_TIMPO|nr:unnamed protein product [Timema poppensis]